MSESEDTRFFALSGYTLPDTKAHLAHLIISLGGVYLESEELSPKCTHLIITPLKRSEKCLSATASGLWILSVDYILDSHKCGYWLEEEKYEWTAEKLESYFKPSIVQLIGSAVIRNRICVYNSGRKRCSGWTCYLSLSDKKKQAVYRRMLKNGGAVAYTDMNIKFWQADAELAITHVFTEAKLMKDIQNVIQSEPLYLHIDYIRNFLLRDPAPEANEFLLNTYVTADDPLHDMTVGKHNEDQRPHCPRLEILLKNEAAKQSTNQSEEVAKIRKKPTQQLMIPEEEKLLIQTPNLTPTKITSILKRLSKIPIIAITRNSFWGVPFLEEFDGFSTPDEYEGKEQFVPCELHPDLVKLFNHYKEEEHPEYAITNLLIHLSPQQYLPPTILATLFSMVLQPSSEVCREHANNLLTRMACYHPPVTPDVCRIYKEAFSLHSGKAEPPWVLFSSVIKNCLAGEDSECEFMLTTLIELLEKNFKHFLSTTSDPSKQLLDSSSCPLVCSIFWPDSKVGTLNKTCKEFLVLFSQSLRNDDILPAVQQLLCFVLECVRLVGVTERCQREESAYSRNCHDFALEIIDTCAVPFQQKPLVRKFLASTNPVWFRMLVSEMLLQTVANIGFQKSNTGTLSLEKIVTHYMIPEVVSTAKDHSSKLTRFSRIVQMTDHHRTAQSFRKKSVAIRNQKGETKLHQVCIRNNVSALKNLLSIPGLDVNAKDNAGWTPLHEASVRGHTECVQLLLQWRPHPDYVSAESEKQNCFLDLVAVSEKEGLTPLHDAIQNDHLEVAELLLKYGGKRLLHIRDNKGNTPLTLPMSEEMRSIVTSEQIPTGSMISDTSYDDHAAYTATVQGETEVQSSSPSSVSKLSQTQCREFLDYLCCVTDSYIRWMCLQEMHDAWQQFKKQQLEITPLLIVDMYRIVHGFHQENMSVVRLLYHDLMLIPKLSAHLKKLQLHVEKITGKNKKDFGNELVLLEMATQF